MPSERIAVAVKGCVRPAGRLAFEGATSMDTRVAVVTVTVVDPATPLEIAVIVLVPDMVALLVTSPREPAALDTVAIVGLLEVHVTRSVQSGSPRRRTCRSRGLAA